VSEANGAVSSGAGRLLAIAEDVVYALVGVVLVSGAGVLLVNAVYRAVTELDESVTKAIQDGLESLLLVFVLVELLAAVRATLAQQRMVAEPFLVVGMIASIKEIIVTSITAKDALEHDPDLFRRAMTEIGVLGAVLVALAVALYLVRRKEREPQE
jgi:uncharacterized membrane protein (DUF373 family)